VVFAWAAEDRFFKIAFAERLAAVFPDARVEPIADSYTFVPEDQPEVLAGIIEECCSPSTSATPRPTSGRSTTAA
jgi:pimeloyl-ACP methyl ester carboxylesterase